MWDRSSRGDHHRWLHVIQTAGSPRRNTVRSVYLAKGDSVSPPVNAQWNTPAKASRGFTCKRVGLA